MTKDEGSSNPEWPVGGCCGRDPGTIPTCNPVPFKDEPIKPPGEPGSNSGLPAALLRAISDGIIEVGDAMLVPISSVVLNAATPCGAAEALSMLEATVDEDESIAPPLFNEDPVFKMYDSLAAAPMVSAWDSP